MASNMEDTKRPASYFIRRASGSVLGPFSAPLILQMIRSAKLKGDEGISENREDWIPILAHSSFAAAFEDVQGEAPLDPNVRGRTMHGMAALGSAAESSDDHEAPGQGTGSTFSSSRPAALDSALASSTQEDDTSGSLFSREEADDLDAMFDGGGDDADDMPLPSQRPPRPSGTLGAIADPLELEEIQEATDDSFFGQPVGGGTPAPTEDLPMAGHELPGRASDLPASASELPGIVGGLDGLDADWPDASPELPARASELPADAEWAMPGTAAEPTPLDELEELDLPQAAGAQTRVPMGASELAPEDLLEEDLIDDDPFGEAQASAAPSEGEDDLAQFFDDAPGGAAAAAGGAATPATAKAAAKKGSGGASALPLRIVAAAALLFMLVAVVLVVQLDLLGLGSGGEDSELVVAPEPQVEAPPVRLGELDEIRDGDFSTLQAFLQTGRDALRGGGVETRARLLVGAALHAAVYPDSADLREEMDGLYRALANEDATPLIQFARGAYLAAVADDGALPMLGLLRDGEYGDWAELFRGLHAQQVLRGVEPPVAVIPEEPESDDEGDEEEEAVAEGAENEDAAPEPEAEEEPALAERVAVVVDEAERRRLLQSAEAAFGRAARRDAQWVLPRYLRARTLLEMGQSSAARAAVQEVLSVQPEHTGAGVLLGTLELRAGEIAAADSRARTLVSERADAMSAQELAAAHALAAEAALSRFDRQDAITSLRSALQAAPANRAHAHRLAVVLDAPGYHRDALDLYERISDLGVPPVELAHGRTRALIGIGDLEEAETLIQRQRGDVPDDARFLLLSGRVYEERTLFVEARRQYERALQIDPSLLEAELRIADLDRRGARRSEAIGRLDQVVRSPWRDADSMVRAGEAFLALGEENQAVSAFLGAVDLDRSHPEAWLNLIEYYVAGGEYRRALARINMLAEAGIEHPILSALRARTRSALGEHNDALEEMTALIDRFPNNLQYRIDLGRIHFAAGNWEASRDAFRAALEFAPTSAEALFWRARADIELGSLAEAITALNNVNNREESGKFRYWLGFALEQNDQLSSALGEYTRAVELSPGWSLANPEVYFRRGQILARQGSLDSAYADLRTVLTVSPDHAEANRALGEVHFANGLHEPALRAFERSLAQGTSEIGLVHYFMGRSLLALVPPQRDRARGHFETAREANFGMVRPDLHRRLAYVYSDLRRSDAAIAEFRRFLQLADDLPYRQRREMENEIRRLGGSP